MDVWMFVEGKGIQRIVVPWLATIHVHANALRLEHLINWLECGEIAQRFAVGPMRLIRSRLSLDQYEMHDVLEIEMKNNRSIRSLAEHIESRGDYHRYALYSIDAHLAQRFFVEHNIARNYRKNVGIDKAKKSKTITVSVTHSKPEKAAYYANNLMEEIKLLVESDSDKVQSSQMNYLSETLADALQEMEIAEENLKNYEKSIYHTDSPIFFKWMRRVRCFTR